MRSTACSQSCLLEQRFEPLAVAHEHVVDAEPLGLVAELLPLALEDVALPLVLFDAFVEVVERFDRAFFERAQIGEAFELVVDLAALDPQRLEVDRDFQPAGAGGERFRLGLPAFDFLGQLAKLHGRLRPAAALGDQLVELAAKLLALREQRADLGFLVGRVQQPQPRAVEHVDHIVQRDAIQAGREPVEPLGGGRVAERAELLHFAQADGEDVVVRRLVDVLERFAQQAVALLFAVGGDDRSLCRRRSGRGRRSG